MDLPPDDLAEYADSYADPGMVSTFTEPGHGLELSAEQLDQPGALQPAIRAPTPPPAPVSFLARDKAVSGGRRLPFVRDAGGRVQWVSSSLRLVPRVRVHP